MVVGDKLYEMGTVILQVDGAWLRFVNPVREVVAWRTQDVMAALAEVEIAGTEQNLIAAGFMTYEASSAFKLSVQQPSANELPLLWFGLYKKSETLATLPRVQREYRLGKWASSVSWAGYRKAIHKIKTHIAAGDTYQVNYTFPLSTSFHGDSWALFSDLAHSQRANYAAYIDLGRFAICSASPELFFRQDGDLFTTCPMKGTAGRGRTAKEDREQIDCLAKSEKNRAENLMIVDMMRNDLGRIAKIGSVKVPRLFEIERYPTLLQMTSTVTAYSQSGFSEIISTLFPCASITGAPKVRTMEIIQSLEAQPRGVYTGMIGMIAPGRKAQFNVAIRTVVVDRELKEARYGVGSGVVWDSDAEAEFNECRLKTHILTQKWPDFDLLESLLWIPDEGYFLLRYHLDRLLESAEYFSIKISRHNVKEHLGQLAETLTEACKIRLLIGQNGAISSQNVSLGTGAMPNPVRVALASVPVDSSTVWLYHKTTHRPVYSAAQAECPNCDDVILQNKAGHITETTNSNVVVFLDGKWLTPPVKSGLLAGTFRRHLLKKGRILERNITVEDLYRSEQIFLINSVRKWQKVVLVKP